MDSVSIQELKSAGRGEKSRSVREGGNPGVEVYAGRGEKSKSANRERALNFENDIPDTAQRNALPTPNMPHSPFTCCQELGS